MTVLDTIRQPAGPARVGQSTAVEQSRAVAEVGAAVLVAQQCPRSVQMAIEDMEDACRQIELAEVAFFRFPRAGETVQGPSVHLARELARCWGNIQYGVRELSRDDGHRQSEMQAWAWDVQKNTRDSSDFIVPHQRDTKKGVKDLVDLRDIYENNANNGARRLREMIFAMLPVWFRARAEKLCRETIESGGGVPIATRRADAVKAFERFRVSPARLAAKFGYKGIDELNATDVAQLGVIWQSLSQGTVTVADEFPEEAGRISAADLAPAAPAATPDASPAGTEDYPPVPPEPSASPAAAAPAGEAPDPAWEKAMKGAQAQSKRVFGDDRAKRLAFAPRILMLEQGAVVRSYSHLTTKELGAIMDTLSSVDTVAELEALLSSGQVPGGK